MSWFLKIFNYLLPTILNFFSKKYLKWVEERRISQENAINNADVRKQNEEAQTKEERDAAAQRIADNF